MAQASEETEAEGTCSETTTWVQLATTIQQRFYELFEGRLWEPVDITATCLQNLEKNIGYALFGPPPQLPGDDSDTISGYDNDQLKKIRKIHPAIVKLISKKPKNIMFLFISMKQNKEHLTSPVFRIVDDSSPDARADYFVDFKGRVYRGWDDFVKNNAFPHSLLCCPKNGMYSQTNGKVDVEFIQPAAARSPRKVLDALNLTTAIAATSVGVATLVIAVPGSIVLAATIGGVISGCYGLGYNINNLVDRSLHGQTLGLKSTEARNTWLGVIGNTTGIALGGTDAVRSMFLPGNTNCLRIVSSLSIGSSAVRGLSVINGIADITNKAKRTGMVTPLDAYQLSASVLFFGGSVISIESASNALKRLVNFDTQNVTGIISTIEKVDDVLKKVIPNSSNSVMESENEKKEKNEFREVNKTKLQDLPDQITEEIEGIKIISIEKHLAKEMDLETPNNCNMQQIQQVETTSTITPIKLIKLLSSPSLKLYQVDHTPLPLSEKSNNDGITLIQFSDELLENDDGCKSSPILQKAYDKKQKILKVKNALAALQTLEATKKGTYTLSKEYITNAEKKTTNDEGSKNLEQNVTPKAGGIPKIPENDSLPNLLELAKIKQSQEECTYKMKKNSVATTKSKINKILEINKFRHCYTPAKSTENKISHNETFYQQSCSSDEELCSHISSENKDASDVLSYT